MSIRVAYCQQAPIVELVDHFREAVARMATRHCKNPVACGIAKRQNSFLIKKKSFFNIYFI
jgi:hypothetical protein